MVSLKLCGRFLTSCLQFLYFLILPNDTHVLLWIRAEKMTYLKISFNITPRYVVNFYHIGTPRQVRLVLLSPSPRLLVLGEFCFFSLFILSYKLFSIFLPSSPSTLSHDFYAPNLLRILTFSSSYVCIF